MVGHSIRWWSAVSNRCAAPKGNGDTLSDRRRVTDPTRMSFLQHPDVAEIIREPRALVSLVGGQGTSGGMACTRWQLPVSFLCTVTVRGTPHELLPDPYVRHPLFVRLEGGREAALRRTHQPFARWNGGRSCCDRCGAGRADRRAGSRVRWGEGVAASLQGHVHADAAASQG